VSPLLPVLLLLLPVLVPELSKLRADNLELAASLQVRPAAAPAATFVLL
jgi:hypothetical protein